MTRVLVILGTRAEIVKCASLIFELRKHPSFEVFTCHTGQHREMAQQALATFKIVPDYSFEFSHLDNSLVSGMMSILGHLEWVIKEKSWDLVVVQGDTTSALAGALSAFYHKVPVGHVEAGLRTYDRSQPWPEEGNRRIISQIADWHFAPTKRAIENLTREQVPGQICLVGNTVIDALLWVQQRYGLVGEMMIPGSILVTAHRRENWAEGILNICTAIRELVLHSPNVLFFVWPLHPNRVIRDTVERELGTLPAVLLDEPLSYPALVRQMMTAQIILTDSGGIQEEAPTLNTPVLILRDKTERPEAIECGAAKLVGTDPDTIVAEVTRLLTDKEEYERMANAKNPFGDGHAAERIAECLSTH